MCVSAPAHAAMTAVPPMDQGKCTVAVYSYLLAGGGCLARRISSGIRWKRVSAAIQA